MAIDPDQLLNWEFPKVEQTYTHRDTMLYALGVGLGSDPLDKDQLRFVYERDLVSLPTMPTVLCSPGPWNADPRLGITRGMIVHGEQRVTLHASVPPAATLQGRTRIVGVHDKGAGRGALIDVERRVTTMSGEPVATLLSTTFARADGGFGGTPGPARQVRTEPERPPDAVVDLPTARNAALIYRLSGDYNPLHADPDAARTAGFDRPILHGLCSFGMASHAVMRGVCGFRPEIIREVAVRFSAPVFPGDTVSFEFWRTDDGVLFRAGVRQRNAIVLKNGVIRFHEH